MANELPPYVNATGVLQNVLSKIKEAPPPPRFTQDFLYTKLGFRKTGSTNSMIPFLKRIGFLGSDGIPTEVYKKFRNPDSKISGSALAEAMRIGYSDLYARNEYFHNLEKNDLKNFLIEATESDPKSGAIRSLINTMQVLISSANFDGRVENRKDLKSTDTKNINQNTDFTNPNEFGFNLSYTINLNLPETSDVTVFDAIFKSLKENLLKKESE